MKIKFERNVFACFFKTPEVMQYIIKGLLPLDYIKTPDFTISIFDDPITGDWVVTSADEEIIHAFKKLVESYETY